MRQQQGSMIPWQGGKFYSAETIVDAFPNPTAYSIYCELFCGACHVLIRKPSYSHVEVINDLNNDLVNFWMQFRDNIEALEERCRSLPYSREVYYTYHKSLFDGTELEPLERAARWFYVLRSNFSAYLQPSPGGWHNGIRTKDRQKWGGNAQSYHSAIDLFLYMQKRFKHIMIDNRDFEFVFKQWDKPRTLFYVDPPYVDFEAYYGQGKQGFTLQDHERLAQLLNNSSAYIALSYYPHSEIDRLYPADKWRRVTWETYKHSQRTKDTHDASTELLLLNYPPQQPTLWHREDLI